VQLQRANAGSSSEQRDGGHGQVQIDREDAGVLVAYERVDHRARRVDGRHARGHRQLMEMSATIDCAEVPPSTSGTSLKALPSSSPTSPASRRLMICWGTPSSRTSKSSIVSPDTGRPSASRTTTSTV